MEATHIVVAMADDEPQVRAQMKDMLQRYGTEQQVELTVHEFSSGEELLKSYRPDYDLVMLDVEMGARDGFETAKALRNIDPAVDLLFVTNMAQYAIRGYEVDATSYLVKPVSYYALSRELGRCITRKRQREATDALSFSSNGVVSRVPLSSIVYIESVRHKIIVHGFDTRYEFNGALKSLLPLLEDKGFFLSNSCYAVNMRYVTALGATSCTMSDGTELAVSRRRKKDFKEALAGSIG